MPSESPESKLDRLKKLKSAYILEAEAATARGLEVAALGLFARAGELELQLADLLIRKNVIEEREGADILASH